MRIPLALWALAPFALAACDRQDAVPAADKPTAANGTDSYPVATRDARSSVDYAGTYIQQTGDGRQRTITLTEDDTFLLRDENGVETNGAYRWYSDNTRIRLRTNEQSQVYALAKGYLYRLADEGSPLDSPVTDADVFVKMSDGTEG